MLACEGSMIRRVPVLCGHTMSEALKETIDHRHHRITARHWQRSPWHEVRLHIDQNQNVSRRVDVDRSIVHDALLLEATASSPLGMNVGWMSTNPRMLVA